LPKLNLQDKSEDIWLKTRKDLIKTENNLTENDVEKAWNDFKKKQEEEKKKNVTLSKPEDLPKALQLLKAKLLALATQLKK